MSAAPAPADPATLGPQQQQQQQSHATMASVSPTSASALTLPMNAGGSSSAVVPASAGSSSTYAPLASKSHMPVDVAAFMLGPALALLMFGLNYLGFPYLFIAAVSGIVCLLFAYREHLSLELFVSLLTSLIVHVFFRDIDSRNTHSIPAEGPVIFVCAPHANQFLDPAVMQQFVPRPVSFLIAAKSYHQRLIGTFARAQRSIPVERPQDLAKAVPGKVTLVGLTVTAVNTPATAGNSGGGKDAKAGQSGAATTPDFTTVFSATDSIMIASEVLPIASITATTITLKSAHPNGDFTTPVSFKRVPKVKQDQVRVVYTLKYAYDFN